MIEQLWVRVGDAGEYESFGNDFDARWLEDVGIAHISLDQPVRELLPGIHAVTDFPRVHPDEIINPRFKLRHNGTFVPVPDGEAFQHVEDAEACGLDALCAAGRGCR